MNTVATTNASTGRGDGGGDRGGGMSDADVTALRGLATSMARTMCHSSSFVSSIPSGFCVGMVVCVQQPGLGFKLVLPFRWA